MAGQYKPYDTRPTAEMIVYKSLLFHEHQEFDMYFAADKERASVEEATRITGAKQRSQISAL